MRPLSTSRDTPLRICLSAAVTCRLRISSSATSTPFWFRLRIPGLGGPGDHALAARSRSAPSCTRGMLVGELDQFGEGGPGQSLGDAALHPGPEQLGGTGLVAIGLVRAGALALGVEMEAL